ncbi:MAG: isoprenylcysteine carboxylmethyltransferase family protein [Thermoguttaceae bacterium]|jgi:protein-S-isoprenylcysteine O-methyltransferase Ste14
MYTAVIVLRVLALIGPSTSGLMVRLYQAYRSTGPVPAPPAVPAAEVRQGSRVPMVAWAVAGCLFVVALCLPLTIPRLTDTALLVLAVAGVVLEAAGSAIILWARAALGARWSLAPRASRAAGLVTLGPFAQVRHPVYLGVVVALAGIAAVFANWGALLACLLLVVPALLWRAKVEEELLADVFSEEYRLYRQRTKMLIPYLL